MNPTMREGQDDRQVQRALVEVAAAELSVEQHRQEDAERRSDEQEEGQPHAGCG